MSAKPVSLPLYPEITNRGFDNTKDAYSINVITEKLADGTTRVIQRPGFSEVNSFAGLTATPGPLGMAALGTTSLNVQATAIFHGGNTIRVVATSSVYNVYIDLFVGVVVSAFAMVGQQTAYPNQSIFVTSGRVSFRVDVVYNPGSGTTISSTSITTGLAYFAAPVVNYHNTFYGLTVDGRLYNSAVNDCTSWPAINYVTVQTGDDYGVALAVQLDSLVVLKKYSTQVYYDANNPAGSPLALNASAANLNFGCYSPATVVNFGNDLVWVGVGRTGGMAVVRMRNLQLEVVSTASIDRQLLKYSGGTLQAMAVHISGKPCYVLCVSAGSLPGEVTFVYNLVDGTWSLWEDPSGNPFPYGPTVQDQLGNCYYLPPVPVGSTSLPLCKFSETLYTDFIPSTLANTPFPVQIVTPLWDGGTYRQKHIQRTTLVGDMDPSQTITVETTDDDYVTWPVSRTVNSSNGQASLFSCGSTRRRAWRITKNGNTPFRLERLEIEPLLSNV